MADHFQYNLRRGLLGEGIISSWLRSRGRKSIDHQSDRHAKGMVYWNFNMLRRLADQGELIK